MKFKFNNLGLLHDGEIELSPLTIICGENNTGKTYATYAIYGFMSVWRQMMRRAIHKDIGKLGTKSSKLDLKSLYEGKIEKYFQDICSDYIVYLPRVFAIKDDTFNNTSFNITLAEKSSIWRTHYVRNIEDADNKVIATLVKEKDDGVLSILISDDSEISLTNLREIVSDYIVEIIFAPHMPKTFIASAERTGAAIFRKELDFSRSRMLEALSSLSEKELRNPFNLLRQLDAGYPLPVRDNVDFVRQLEDLDKTIGPTALDHPEILSAFENIIGGSYKVVKEQGLIYQPKGTSKPKFTMSASSSCVRALLDVGYYIKCRAQPGDMLIIDEPELNLHPKNQRSLARLLVMLVNAGVKVFITTHSDYLIKEFNTLIMLARRTPHNKAMQEKFNYSDAELLSPEHVNLYMTTSTTKSRKKVNTVKKAKVYADRGIEVTTFDSTIEDINNIQDEIFYGEGL
ncbi:AAA family ATPase [Aeromonas veronii]|uniref:AAA family ATPase n=1 Tax=Aeromonas veronii TaxID=654 RepID=UPI00244461B7|nr:AAA family ATPase [Aeromonas veronii]